MTRPRNRGETALAATTAKNGRNTAPKANTHRMGWLMTTSSTKQIVRTTIVTR